ncbi:MAG TPA: FGGY-family carbohydrate kinase [Pseudonocardiaceae bacterium]|nr:FGGY-family carbohydrate kinase [Pseudonocardiaceae bacterium]
MGRDGHSSVSLLLGVDIGTSSSKGVLVRDDGTIVATAIRAHETSMPHPGWVEHDAQAVWWADFVAICQELAAAAREPLAAVGVSGIGPCLLPVDAEDRPLRPAILYGVDTRAQVQIEELTRALGEQAILERCGSLLTSQAVGPKLAWLRANEPGTWAATRRFLMASSFLVHRLTGNYILDHHSASQCTPMYDTVQQQWIKEWTELIAPGLELPELRWPSDVVGEVHATAAEQTGIPAGTPVVAGTIDAWAEATSVGVTAPGDVMLMYGTTMFLVEVLDHPRRSPHLWGTVGTFPGTYNFAAGMATSGAITEWIRKLTGESAFDRLVAEAQQSPPGANGLLMLPYFAGERTPLFDPDARGVLIGLTLRHHRGDIYRAALEATAYGVRHNLHAMREAGGQHQRLVAVGGGTKGGLWTQIVSDVLNAPQQLPRQTIGACLGDALLAAIGIGQSPQVTQWNPIAITIEPRSEPAAAYESNYTLYRQLYPNTRHIAHALAHQQRAGSSCIGGS